MKTRSLAALLLAAVLLLGGCTPPIGPDDGTIPPVSDSVGESGTDTAADTSPDTETPTDAPSEEETEPLPEPPPALSLAAQTLTTEGDNIVLSLSCLLRDDTVTGELFFDLPVGARERDLQRSRGDRDSLLGDLSLGVCQLADQLTRDGIVAE